MTEGGHLDYTWSCCLDNCVAKIMVVWVVKWLLDLRFFALKLLNLSKSKCNRWIVHDMKGEKHENIKLRSPVRQDFMNILSDETMGTSSCFLIFLLTPLYLPPLMGKIMYLASVSVKATSWLSPVSLGLEKLMVVTPFSSFPDMSKMSCRDSKTGVR